MQKYEDSSLGKSAGINDLRDTLAKLKWEILQHVSPLNRKDLTGNEWENYKQDRYKEWPYFNDDYIAELVFKPKNLVTNEEAFDHVKKLTPNKNNAFLFDKRIHDQIRSKKITN